MKRRSLHLLFIAVLAVPLMLTAVVALWLGLHHDEPDAPVRAWSTRSAIPSPPLATPGPVEAADPRAEDG